MSELNDVVADHYRQGDLLASIRAGVAALGKSPDELTLDDLSPVEEFHVGGRRASSALCEQLAISGDDNVVDLGSGIGGLARFIAAQFGATVTGVDLTPEYVEAATTLTEWLGLSDLAKFQTGNIAALPFDDASFDVATLLHVGMNIDDKAALFAEAHRVLRPGGRLGVYDNMWAGTARDLDYPVPWAADSTSSFVEDLGSYATAAEAAGFTIAATRDCSETARTFFSALRSRSDGRDGPPPLGLHLLMGHDAGTKTRNLATAITTGLVAPTEMICVKP